MNEGSEGEAYEDGGGEDGEGEAYEDGGGEDGEGEAGEKEILLSVEVAEEKESPLLTEVLQPSIWGIALFLANTAALLLSLVVSNSFFAHFCSG